MMGIIRVKRAYEQAAAEDGTRVLVDRLWPRGVSRERAALDTWAKDSAPSPELRTWFAHDPARFAAFTVRYNDELDTNQAAAALARQCAAWLRTGNVTLVYAARDPVHNHAIVLRDWLLRHAGSASAIASTVCGPAGTGPRDRKTANPARGRRGVVAGRDAGPEVAGPDAGAAQ